MIKNILLFPLACLFCAVLPNCGGDDDDDGGTPSTATLVADCKAVCEKSAGCAMIDLDCDSLCDNIGEGTGEPTGEPAPETDCTYSQYSSKQKACIEKSCEEYTGCLDQAATDCGFDPGASGS